MALVNTLKEYLLNIVSQNAGGKITTADGQILNNFFNNITVEDSNFSFAAVNQATWADNTLFFTMSRVNKETEGRQLLKFYNRIDFLNTFNDENVFIGNPNLQNTKNKNSFNSNENIIFYIGRTTQTGSLTEQETEIHRFYTFSNNQWRGVNGAPYAYIESSSLPLYIGSFSSADSVNFNLTRPLFNISTSKAYLDDAVLINASSINYLNVYAGITTDDFELTETNYFIKDDIDDSVYHLFRVYNKNQIMQMLNLFGIKEYYNNSEDLVAGVNSFPVEFSEDTPGDDLPPGQKENEIKNKYGLGNFESDVINYPVNAITGAGTGITTYILNYEQMQYVLNKVWDPSIIDIITNFDLSPIVNCLIWPCPMTSTIEGTTAQSVGVYIGKSIIPFSTLDPMINYYITKNYIKILDFGTIELKSENFYNSFLDYEPYSTYNLYLPYCGVVPIAARDVLNQKVKIVCCLDISTGAGKYIILIDGVGKYFYDCQIGVQIQLTNSNFSESLNGLVRNSVGQIGNFREGAKGIISSAIGNVGSALNNFDVSTIGTSGNGNDRLNSQEAYFIIERCETVIPNDFPKNYGRPSMITTQLKKLKGFTTVPNVLIETTATEAEKKQIINLLNQGVIIK